ncbi:CU044_5270 family protein [Streptomyces sp. NPDC057694]|uniref:CU044_5270 family protein n=1 Tax=Streptomyces sp. NPDC057694 TaxID=3346216 RepID=UPI00368C594F
MNLDEMKDVRGFRAGAPTPDRGRLAEGRARLTGAAQDGRARRIRADWRLAAVGAAAALTAVAVLATGIGGDGADRSAPADTRRVEGSVGEVLERAATAMEKGDPPATPHAGQWIYTKTLSRDPGVWPKDKSNTQPSPRTGPQESWTLYADPRFENGKEGDDRSPRERLQFLNALPSDPDAVLKKIRAYYPSGKDNPESEGEHDMRAMSVVLETRPMPPKALAKLYRALAAVPGAEVTPRLVHDAAGRDAIAVGHDEKGQKVRREILIDPRTYQYLGDRWLIVKDYKESFDFPGGPDDNTPDRPWKAGDIMFQNALLDTAVVDHKGDRP